jgi:hypothetical protein
MKRIHKILMLAALAGAALPSSAMPIGLRTAVWGVSSANGRAAVGRLLPETDSTSEIKAALKDFSDKTVEANIADDSTYEEFRDWALESGARADTLAASSTAWLSFAAGSPVLVGAPQDGDLVIDEVSPAGPDGAIEMIFSLADVEIGQQAPEARLKTVFGVVGAKTLNGGAFSDANLTFSLMPTDDGRMKAVVTPKRDENGNLPTSFFVKVKMK